MGLLRGRKLRIRIAGVGELTSARDEGVRELLKENTLRKAELFPNKEETLTPRNLNAMAALFSEFFGKDVAREPDEIANATHDCLATAREQLTQVQAQLRRIPGKVQPKALDKLEVALEGCRRSRNTDPTLKALKRHLDALRDGLVALRMLQNDLNEQAVSKLADATDFRAIRVPQLAVEIAAGRIEAVGLSAALGGLTEVLDHPQPWSCAAALSEHVATLKDAYVTRRKAILAQHQTRIEEALSRLKLRDGFDTLSQDQQYQVLEHVRTGAAFDTTAEAPVPSLGDLQERSSSRVNAAFDKALLQLDELRESQGEKPTISLALAISGREIATEAELDRFLEELRQQLSKELSAGHRIRLK
jgi:hypothetical protein